MKLCSTFHALAVVVSLLATAQGYSRGGETGTLHEAEKPIGTSIEVSRVPVKNWEPYYLDSDHFRRLRARLSMYPMAPIPGWDARAWRHQDRYFTEDGIYEILPIVRETFR